MQHGLTANGLGKQFRRYHPDRPTSFKAAIARGFRRAQSVDRFWALRDVSFRVAGGEMLGVIGSNGSGKSTLLHLIGGVMAPDEGRVEVRGRVRALLELGSGFHPELSGRENILVGGVAAGLLRRDVEARFDDIVAFAEIEDFLDSPLRTYSAGMKLRLGFSVAVHSDPEILLIDEVLTVGDLAFQFKCLDRIRQYQADGCAIVLVSHDLDQVARLCDHVLWLKHGSAVAFGPPDVVIGQYRAAMTSETRRRLPVEHPARRTPSGTELKVGENRFGSLEVEITRVRLLDACDKPCTEICGGEALTVEIDYEAPEAVEAPIFCVSVGDEERVVTDLATDADNIAMPSTEKAGTVRLEFARLDLAGGQYFIDVGVFEKEWAYAYDFHWHVYPLLIDAKRAGQSMIIPPHRWEMRPGIPSNRTWDIEQRYSTSIS